MTEAQEIEAQELQTAQPLLTERLIAEHEAWRRTTLNLIASENAISPAVRRALDNDLVGRYTDYTGRDLAARRYRGNQYVVEIEREAEALAKTLFHASEVDLRPLSGHLAGASVILGLCEAGDTILEIGPTGGSHRMAAKFAERSPVQLNVRFLPFDEAQWNVDIPAALAMIAETQARMVILGSSAFLFPQPITALAEAVHRLPGTVLVYDASHVLGLIAGGKFQQPLSEGADIVYGSTHKTLPGPQGGLIYSNSAALMDRIAQAIYPPLVTNHHSFRIPALSIAFNEMLQHGPAYASQIIANAQALGAALTSRGVPPLTVNGRWTESHTLLVPIAAFAPNATNVAERLETCGIITGAFRVPDAVGGVGLRLGTQELTRLGAREADMDTVAELLITGLRDSSSPATLAGQVASFVGELPGLTFA